jgi:hypothetical protein
LSFKRIIPFLVLAAILCGCEDSSKNNQDEQQVRLTKMLDERRYDDVIHLIESDPSASAAFPDLLAMGYLGKSGFEPLAFAENILAAQTADPALDHLIAGCDLSALDGASVQPQVRCVLRRLWAHLPDPDDVNFAKARDLFRAAYPTAASTPVQYNVLIGVVESVSVLSRLGRIALQYDAINVSQTLPSQSDVDRIFSQLKLAADEALRVLTRASYGGSKISGLLTGLKKVPLIQNTGITVEWLQATEIPLVIQFINDPNNGVESDVVKAALLQFLDQVIAGLQAPVAV